MAEPDHVVACVAAMAEAARDTPVSVKCRIGISPRPDPERDEYELCANSSRKLQPPERAR